MWSPGGRELYFRRDPGNPGPAQSGAMWTAAIDTAGANPRVSAPRALSPERFQGIGDVAPDGRLLLVKHTQRAAPARVIRLVFNWFDDLRARTH